MNTELTQKLVAIKAHIAVHGRRVIDIANEAEGRAMNATQATARLYAYNLCLEMRQALDEVHREVKRLMPEEEAPKAAKASRHVDPMAEVRAVVDVARLELKMRQIGETLNTASLVADEVIDIWGKKLPSGGLYEK